MSVSEFVRLCQSDDADDRTRARTEIIDTALWDEITVAEPWVREAAVMNKTTGETILSRFVRDPESRVRYSIALRRCTSPQDLATLAKDPDETVRHRVALHHRASVETLALLVNDKAQFVRDAAARSLSNRNAAG